VALLIIMKYVILSSNLRLSAKGHYLPFHETLYHGFLSEGLNVTYLGAKEQLEGETWYKAVLPPGLNKPLPWIPFKSLSNELDRFTQNEDFTIIIFEGDLATTVLIARYLIKNKRGFAIVNQFRGDRLARKLNGRITKFTYSRIYKLAVEGSSHRLMLSSDNSNFQNLLKKSFIFPILRFPMFSQLSESKSKIERGDKILILVRGSKATSLVLKALLRRNKDFTYVIHGITKGRLSAKEYLEGVEVSERTLSQSEYQDSYRQFRAVVIMYAPEDFEYVSSGRIYDALQLGIPVYAPRQTSMAAELEEAFTFDFESEDSLTEIINRGTFANLPIKIHKSYSVSRTVSELVATTKSRHHASESEFPSKNKIFYRLLLGVFWNLYGAATFILLRGFLKPKVFIDTIKMKSRKFLPLSFAVRDAN